MLCHSSGLIEEEVGCSIAAGTAAFANGDRKAAFAAYRQGKEIAEQHNLPMLAVQATFGIAAIHYATPDYERARITYRVIAADDKVLASLRIEAWRMAGECSLAMKDLGAAAGDLEPAITIAESTQPDERRATSYTLVGQSLFDLYKSTGQHQRLHELAERLDRLDQPSSLAHEVSA